MFGCCYPEAPRKKEKAPLSGASMDKKVSSHNQIRYDYSICILLSSIAHILFFFLFCHNAHLISNLIRVNYNKIFREDQSHTISYIKTALN